MRDRTDGPRALRAACAPWGLGDLTQAEQRQLELGSALMRTMLLFLAAARAFGFAAVMEHPQEPEWAPGAPSCWKLPEMRALVASGHVQRVHLDQCCCGTPWRKPTCLLAVRMPELADAVAALPGGGRCNAALGHSHVSLLGRSTEGHFLTAPAKTYNGEMCRVIAGAALGASRRLLAAHRGVRPCERPLTPEFERLCVPVDWYDPGSWAAWSPDRAWHRGV